MKAQSQRASSQNVVIPSAWLRSKLAIAGFSAVSESDLHASSRLSVIITFPCLYNSQKDLKQLSEGVLHHKYVGSTKLHTKEG